MADQFERTPRRGMTFPFFLTLFIFVAVIADLWLTEPGFVASAGWRQNTLALMATVVLGFLLWLWVLAAARRRTTRFEGPVENTRGSNGALQPILATVFLVVGLNLLWSHTLPKWLNGIVADEVDTEDFVIAGAVAGHRSGCSRAAAKNPRFGEVRLCLPRQIAEAVRETPGAVVAVRGPASWFGIEPRRYAFRTGEPIIPAQLTVEPAMADPAADPVPADPREPLPLVDDLLNQIAADDQRPPRRQDQ